MLFEIIIFLTFVRWVFKLKVARCRSWDVCFYQPITDLDKITARKFHSNSSSVTVSMWTPIPGYTTQQGIVSKIIFQTERSSERRANVSSFESSADTLVKLFSLSLFLVREGLQLVQSEWNILRMGNPKYIGQCKLVRFKTIYIESLDTAASIPLMTDGIINVSVIFNVL